ncbi:olfactory receptor 6F1-like [Spea bombifrons]|uniref:olfactory receptor 6F1-like n=1 Tax=Spea bombifrons TaxID=233779 RepID=UPI00234A2531|nr:olfactory receptor 6F1-like [Spea bombifrons]
MDEETSNLTSQHVQNFSKINHTNFSQFILLGFQDLHVLRIPIFMLLTITYFATIVGNLLIIAVVPTSRQLCLPMYRFLSHLSICDILISTNIVPNTLQVILLGGSPLSFSGCLTQLYFFGASAIIECCLLSVMSYDRYLAICKPLHYSAVMNYRVSHYLVVWSWLVGFLQSMVTHSLILQLQFCGPNVIDHFFCDLPPLLALSCSDTSAVEIAVSIVSIVVGILQLVFIMVTYICISASVLQISSSTGRQKAFSTCSSHLTVVGTYYGTLITLYLAPSRGYSFNFNKVLSLLNTVVTPLFNPIIYTLRNRDIKSSIGKLVFMKK